MTGAGSAALHSFSLRCDSSSSSRNSNCSICGVSFSDLRPNACDAAWPAATADAQSRAHGRSVVRAGPGSALVMLPQEGRSDREAKPLTYAEYRMNSHVLIPVRAKKVVQRISQVTPTTAAPRCAPAAANRCLPATSITALASAKPCRSWPVATRSVRALIASRTDTTRHRHTREP